VIAGGRGIGAPWRPRAREVGGRRRYLGVLAALVIGDAWACGSRYFSRYMRARIAPVPQLLQVMEALDRPQHVEQALRRGLGGGLAA
jgi:hypothetical protein